MTEKSLIFYRKFDTYKGLIVFVAVDWFDDEEECWLSQKNADEDCWKLLPQTGVDVAEWPDVRWCCCCCCCCCCLDSFWNKSKIRYH